MDAISEIVRAASVWVIPVVVAITFHEAAHGWVAWRLGDDTARVMGRVTFNPFKHVDPFGTVILPALLLLMRAPFLFGYAKPVPVNFARLDNPRRDMIWVAVAGPAINIVLATASAILLHVAVLLPSWLSGWTSENLVNSMIINLVLAVFNLLPLPPLDGGRIAVGLLPRSLALPLAELERWGLFIIVGALFLLPMIGAQLGLDLNVFRWLVGVPVQFLFDGIASMVGLR